MFQYADLTDTSRLLRLLPDDAFGTKVRAIVDAYGVASPLVDVWYDKQRASAVAVRFDSAMTVACTEDADCEELRLLVDMVGCGSLFCRYDVMKKMYGTDGEDFTSGSVMRYTGQTAVYAQRNAQTFPVQDGFFCCREIYSLVGRNIPGSFTEDGYLYWLSDMTYRHNRGQALVRCIRDGDKTVSCCFTSALTQSAAIISGVACDGDYRGRGLGARCVGELVRELTEEKRDVYVFVLNSTAKGFYEKIGFYECGRWAQREKRADGGIINGKI